MMARADKSAFGGVYSAGVADGCPGSMIRNDIIAPQFGHRGLLIRSTNIAYPSLGRNDRSTFPFVEARERLDALCANRLFGDGCIRSDRESRVLDESAKYNAVWQPIGRPVARQKNDICAMSRRAPELNRLPKA